MRNAILLVGLRRGELVVTLKLELPILDGEDRVGAPLLLVGRPALWRTTTAPFVGEQQLRAIVIERGRVPVGEVGVGDRVEPDGIHRVLDVEQESVPLARTAGETEGRIDRDVVALAERGD